MIPILGDVGKASKWGVKAGKELLEEGTEIAVREARNRALHEAYKRELRQQMQKPFVRNSALNDFVSSLYRSNAKIGSGSTADAIRFERKTGQSVGGVSHTQKGRDALIYLKRWLKQNPTADPGDITAAENIILDLEDALK